MHRKIDNNVKYIIMMYMNDFSPDFASPETDESITAKENESRAVRLARIAEELEMNRRSIEGWHYRRRRDANGETFLQKTDGGFR